MHNRTRAQKPIAITELLQHAFKFNGVNCINKKPKQLSTSKFNIEKLKDPLTKELYQQTLTEKLSALDEN